MTIKIRPTLKRSQWALPKHRFYELYHYCLQYPEWVAEYNGMLGARAISYNSGGSGTPGHPTEAAGIRRSLLKDKIDLIESTARETDSQLAVYILKAVTMDGVTYSYLQTRDHIPCSRNMFYDRRRKFYWILDQKLSEGLIRPLT